MIGWAIAENIVTLLLACGLSTAFYFYTGSPHSFWWMLLMLNMYSFKSKTRS